MGFFDKLFGNPLGAVEDVARDIGGDTLVKVVDVAALIYAPQLVGNWAATTAFNAGLATSTVLTIGTVSQAATTLYVLSNMAGNVDQVGSAQAQGTLINTANNVAQIPVIYGTRRVGGSRVLVQVSGANNEYLHLVIVLGEGEIDSVTNVYIDDVLSSDAKFASLSTILIHSGTDIQPADSALIADIPSVWTTAHKGSGIAYLTAKLKYDSKAYSGFPTITADVKGVKVYDPRTATTAWSDNPALCIRDYLTNTRYGKGIPASLIDDTSIIAAANYCDELVTTPGGNQKRYTCNGVVSVDNSAYNNIKSLLTSCRGMLVFSVGKYKLILDKATTSSFTFDEDVITGNWSIATAGRKDRYNRVTGTFFDPGNNWQPNYGISDSPAYRTVDNNLLLETSIDLPFTTNLYSAQQLAGLQLKQSRFGLTVTFTAFQAGLRCEVGDVVAITHSTPGWVGKLFRVLHMTLREDEEVDVVCHEYDATVYNLDTLTAITSTPTLSLPNPFLVVTPATLTLTSGTADLLVGSDGTVISRIKCTWTVPSDAFSTTAEIQYKLTTDTAWFSIPNSDASQGAAYIAPVDDGSAYDVRVRFINTMGTPSPWVQPASHTVIGKTARPVDVTGLTISQSAAGILLKWNPCTDLDYKETVIKAGTSYPTGTVVFTGNTTSCLFARPGSGTYDFVVKHRDTSLNESANAVGISIVYVESAVDTSTLTLGSIPGTITAPQFSDDHLIINQSGTNIDVELRWNRNAGGSASITWNGSLLQASKPFKPVELGVNNISATEPASPFAGQVWLLP
ncbi:MAG: hypothetical protein CGW95_04770 [Phenylobacterium zucineum]|nr:MAG: hypothetical protein CGW95_04770 [Phenylobacterium zucineum]